MPVSRANRSFWAGNLEIVIFLLFGSISGTIALFRPPLQIPNAEFHLYQMSSVLNESRGLKEENGTFGREIPLGIQNFARFYEHVYRNDFGLESSKFIEELVRIGPRALQEGSSFVPSTLRGISPTIPYLPYAAGFEFTAVLGGTVTQAYFIGAVCNLVAYLLIMALAVWILPAGKFFMALLGLLPAVVWEVTAPSPLGISTALFALFIAYILRLRARRAVMRALPILNLFGLGMALAALGPDYFVGLLLVFLLPRELFERKFIRSYCFVLLILIGVFTMGATLDVIGSRIFDLNLWSGSNSIVSQSISFFSGNLWPIRSEALSQFFSSFFTSNFYFPGQTYSFAFPFWVFVAYGAGIVGLVILESNQGLSFRLKEILWLILVICFFLMIRFCLLSVVQWPAGHSGLYMSQALSFVPVFMLVGFLFLGINRRYRHWFFSSSMGLTCIMCAILSFFQLQTVDKLWKHPYRAAPATFVEGKQEKATLVVRGGVDALERFRIGENWLYVSGWLASSNNAEPVSGEGMLLLSSERVSYSVPLRIEPRNPTVGSAQQVPGALGVRDIVSLAQLQPGNYKVSIALRSSTGATGVLETNEYLEIGSDQQTPQNQERTG